MMIQTNKLNLNIAQADLLVWKNSRDILSNEKQLYGFKYDAAFYSNCIALNTNIFRFLLLYVGYLPRETNKTNLT